MKRGRLQLKDEAAPVEYEIQTVLVNQKRATTGRLIFGQSLGPQLSAALSNMVRQI